MLGIGRGPRPAAVEHGSDPRIANQPVVEDKQETGHERTNAHEFKKSRQRPVGHKDLGGQNQRQVRQV